MSEWVHQDHITLVPNPNYGGTKPTLLKVTLLMVSSAAADSAAYRHNVRAWTLAPDADVNQDRNERAVGLETAVPLERRAQGRRVDSPRRRPVPARCAAARPVPG